jgi:hypothetical protein
MIWYSHRSKPSHHYLHKRSNIRRYHPESMCQHLSLNLEMGGEFQGHVGVFDGSVNAE